MFATATRVAMKTHTYSYNGSIHHQALGGPIGNPLSSAVARTVCLDWDIQFLEKTAKLGEVLDRDLCAIYKRYVDDLFQKHQPTPVGYRWDPATETPIFSQEALQEDSQRQDDERTMLLLQSVANSINKRIQMTIEFPSGHHDNKMPCLDFKCWVDPHGVVLYEYYRKPMCPQSTIYAHSALPWKTKRTVHTQEVVRVLSRCSDSLPWDTQVQHLTQLSARMASSGYPAQFRADVIRSGIRAYRKIQERSESGIRPIHRARQPGQGGEKEGQGVEESVLVQERRLRHHSLRPPHSRV